MSITASSKSEASSDFSGPVAGHIQAWVWTGTNTLTSTQIIVDFIFGFKQTSTYSDNQDFYASIDGDVKYDETINNSKGSDEWQFYQTTKTYNRPVYGTAVDYPRARCMVSGIFDGPTSDTGTHDTTTGIPAKAGATLGAPGSFGGAVNSSSQITYTWTAPGSSGIGPAASSYILQVSTDPSFGVINIYNANVGNVLSKAITGLAKATSYYARVLAVNSVGNGAWSGTAGDTTDATVPDAMATPTVASASTAGFNVAFTAPPNGGSAITSYKIEVSKDNFANVAATFTGVTSSPKTLTGLLPGTKYKARIYAINAVGQSAVSPVSAEIQTLGGVKVWNGSAWIEGIARSWNGSAWVVVIVRKWNGSSWVV